MVHATVKELEALGELVVEFKGGSDGQEYQEAVVQQRVHDAGDRVAKQRLHKDTCSVVLESAFCVFASSGSPIRSAAFPIPNTLCEIPRPEDEQHWDNDIEGELDAAWDVPEHLAVDGRVVVELKRRGGDTRKNGDRREGDADSQNQVVRLDTYVLHGSDRTGRVSAVRYFVLHLLGQDCGLDRRRERISRKFCDPAREFDRPWQRGACGPGSVSRRSGR